METRVTNHVWTDEQIKLARKLWNDGASAGFISQALGPTFSRNMVMGKISRLRKRGLIPERIEDWTKRVPHGDSESKAPKSIKLVTKKSEPVGEIISLPLIHPEDLRKEHCRYPTGDPQAKDFGFCGHVRRSESSYCSSHHDIAYQKKVLGRL